MDTIEALSPKATVQVVGDNIPSKTIKRSTRFMVRTGDPSSFWSGF
ncbi:hypothetical protein [Bradyrhizobium sp. ORS 86]